MILGYHIIVAVTVFVIVGLVVTYTMSATLKHVDPLWCFISYTGNYPVESCIFSLVFNLASAVYVFIVFLRYVQVFQAVGDFPEKKAKRMRVLNLFATLLGIGGAFGLSMTGCFQQRLFHLLHIIGVIFATYCTLGFLVIQTYFTFALPPLAASRAVTALRVAVVTVSSGILLLGPLFTLYLFSRHRHTFDIFESRASTGDAVGYKVGAVLEWILFILNQMFICSFCPDFKKIAVKKDEIVFL